MSSKYGGRVFGSLYCKYTCRISTKIVMSTKQSKAKRHRQKNNLFKIKPFGTKHKTQTNIKHSTSLYTNIAPNTMRQTIQSKITPCAFICFNISMRVRQDGHT